MIEKKTAYANLKEFEWIFYVEYTCKNIDLTIAQKLVEERLEITNNISSYIFVDGTKVISIDKKARDFFGSENGTHLIGGMAIYSNSKLSSFLANFLVKVNLVKYNIPIKIFNDQIAAVLWLKEIKSKNG